jgi:hypothetical protein
LIEGADRQNVYATACYEAEFLPVCVTHADRENDNTIVTKFGSSNSWLISSGSLAVRHDNEHARNRGIQWASTVL